MPTTKSRRASKWDAPPRPGEFDYILNDIRDEVARVTPPPPPQEPERGGGPVHITIDLQPIQRTQAPRQRPGRLSGRAYLLMLAAAVVATILAGAGPAKSTDPVFPKTLVDAAKMAKTDPASVIRLHGFLLHAKQRCGFPYYSPAYIASTQDATAKLKPTQPAMYELVKSGMVFFDEAADELTLDGACASAIKLFPQFIAATR